MVAEGEWDGLELSWREGKRESKKGEERGEAGGRELSSLRLECGICLAEFTARRSY